MESLEFILEEIENSIQDAKDFLYNAKIKMDKLEDMMENGIHDMDNFKRQLHIRGLMTEELEYFIENYMRFCND